MKTNLIFISSFLLLFGIVSTGISQNSSITAQDQPVKGRNFVDKNSDGICDHRAGNKNGINRRNFVDTNNDGICDNRSVKANRANFVDKNNDGVCDNRENRIVGNKQRKGSKNGCCYGNNHRFRNRGK